MPLITVKLIEDVFTPEQKVKIIETLTGGERRRSSAFALSGYYFFSA
jgi:hypothetical protein